VSIFTPVVVLVAAGSVGYLALRRRPGSKEMRANQEVARRKLEQAYAAMETQLGEEGARWVAELREVSRTDGRWAFAASAALIAAPIVTAAAAILAGLPAAIVVLAAAAACAAAARVRATRERRARAARRHELLSQLEALAARKP
jgi:cytochrome c-type biogenesis protein CcmH/NrfF